MNIFNYIHRKETDKRSAKNTQISLLACTIFLHQFERELIHLGFEKELNKNEGEYNYAGMILPIDSKFYTQDDLTDIDFVLCKQHPFSLMGYNQWRRSLTETVGNASCLLDAVLYPVNYMAYMQGMSDISHGIKEQTLKYFGCRDCDFKKEHVIFPWAPFIPFEQTRHITTSPRTTWTSVIQLWEQLADGNLLIQQLLNFMYISTLVCGQIIMKGTNDVIKQALVNGYHIPTLRPEVFGQIGITNIYLRCDDTRCTYDYKVHNDNFNKKKLRQDVKRLAYYYARPLYVQMTGNIGINYMDKSQEEKFWINASLGLSSKRGEFSTKQVFATTKDVNTLAIFEVNLLCI